MNRDSFKEYVRTLSAPPADSGAPSAPPPARKPRRRLRLWLRLFFWTSFVLMVALAAAIALPWPLPGRQALLAEALARRLGCDVHIGSVRVWPLFGEIILGDIRLDYSAAAERFAFTGRTDLVWRMEEAELLVSPRRLLARDWPVDVEVILQKPDPLVARAGQGAFALFPPLNDLADRPTTAPRKSSRWRVTSLAIENGDLDLHLPGASGANRRLVMTDLRMQYSKAGLFGERAALSGRLAAGAQVTPFAAWLTHRRDVWILDSRIDRTAFRTPQKWPVGFEGRTGPVRLECRLTSEAVGRWSVKAKAGSAFVAFRPFDQETTAAVSGARAPARTNRFGAPARIAGSNSPAEHPAPSEIVENEAVVDLVGEFDTITSTAALAVRVQTAATRFDASVDLGFDPARQSYTTITLERLAGGWVALLNARTPSDWPELDPADARITVTGSGGLLRESPWVRRPKARVQLAGLYLRSHDLPFPVRNLALDTTLTSDRVEVKRCRGEWAGGWFALTGAHAGAWLGRLDGATRLNWSFAMRAEDLLTTLPAAADDRLTTSARAAYEKRPFVEGDLAGSGTLVLGWKSKPGRRPTPASRSLQGRLTLREGRIVHPALPAPVTDLNIVCQVTPERLDIRRVRGKFLDTEAAFSARIEGRPYFWNNPDAHCRVQTTFTVDEALRFAPKEWLPKIEAVEPTGNVALALALSGPLRQPFRREDVQTSGILELRNGGLRSPSDSLAGAFHHCNARVELAGNTLRLTRATGWIENVPFSVAAHADLERNTLWANLESSAPYKAIREILPRALSRWRVGGHLASSFTFEASGKNLFKDMMRIQKLTSETIARLPFQWDLRGTLLARDCEMTFESFPTSLTAITGRVDLHNYDWTFTDLTSSWGKTEQCRIRGGGRFRPGDWPVMHIELEAPVLYFDEWIRPWRGSRGSRLRSRLAAPTFEMTGTIRSRRAFYRGHPGTDFYGELSLVSPHGKPDTFRFFNASTNLYGGTLRGRGEIVAENRRSTNTLELQAQGISLPPLLQCETGREQTVEGRLGGTGVFHWHNGNVDSLTGDGQLLITESRFFGNILFRELGRTIKMPRVLDEVTFNSIEAPYRLARQQVHVDKLTMEGPLIAMTGRGVTGFDHSVNYVLELGFRRLPEYAALLDLVVKYFGKIPSTVFSLDLTGTWDEPRFEFHQLGVAEKGLLNALEGIRDIVPF